LAVVLVVVSLILSLILFVVLFFVDNSRLLNSLYNLAPLISGLGVVGLLVGGVTRMRWATWLQVVCGLAAVALAIVAIAKALTHSEYEAFDSAYHWLGEAGSLASGAFAFGFFAEPLPRRPVLRLAAIFVLIGVGLAVVANLDNEFRLPLWYALAGISVTVASAILVAHWQAPPLAARSVET
jgi:hypothetical protein